MLLLIKVVVWIWIFDIVLLNELMVIILLIWIGCLNKMIMFEIKFLKIFCILNFKLIDNVVKSYCSLDYDIFKVEKVKVVFNIINK